MFGMIRGSPMQGISPSPQQGRFHLEFLLGLQILLIRKLASGIFLLLQTVSREDLKFFYKIPLSRSLRRDELIWHFDKNGEFSAKTTYHLAISSPNMPPPCGGDFQWSKLWGLPIPQKIKHFIWRACNNDIPTRENL